MILVTLTNPFARGPTLAPQFATDTAKMVQIGDRISAGESCIADVEDPILDDDAANKRFVQNSASLIRAIDAADTQELVSGNIYTVGGSVGTLSLPDPVAAGNGAIIMCILSITGNTPVVSCAVQIDTDLGSFDTVTFDRTTTVTFASNGVTWALNVQ